MATIKTLIVIALLFFMIHVMIGWLRALWRYVAARIEIAQRCDVPLAEHDISTMLRKIKCGHVVGKR